MSEQNAIMSQFPKLSAALGQRLRAARDDAGLGREDLAQRLKLRPDIVDAVELGDYRALGAPVFVRGYLRSYASAVGVDLAELQPVFEGIGDAPHLGPSPIVVRRNPWNERFLLAGTYLVGTVLVMSILWAAVQTEGFGLVSRLGQPPLPMVPTDTTVNELTIPTGPQQPAADVATADGFEQDADTALPDIESDTISESERSAPMMASMVPVLDRGEARFSVRVAADTWLEIRDGSGKRLKYDIQKAGEQEYRGKPPFDLRVGNAAQAEVLVNGLALDLEPYSRREIARLRLVASGSTLSPQALPRNTESQRPEPDTTER